jgi:hypothetical protein
VLACLKMLKRFDSLSGLLDGANSNYFESPTFTCYMQLPRSLTTLRLCTICVHSV